jgi:hypothetical protein
MHKFLCIIKQGILFVRRCFWNFEDDIRCLNPLLNKLVGGSATSQHCRGEAADCALSPRFMTEPSMSALRREIKTRVTEITGKLLRPDVNTNFSSLPMCA